MPGTNLLDAAEHAGAWRHIIVLLGAGLVTGEGQIVLKNLSSGNGIDTTAAIWFHAGRMPALRTLGSAVLSVVIVGMGVFFYTHTLHWKVAIEPLPVSPGANGSCHGF